MSSPPRPYPAIAWLFPCVWTLHNLEEALWLPAWSQRAGAFQPPVGAAEFRFAVSVLTVFGFALTALARARGGAWLLALVGLWGAVLLNVVFPHVAATVALRAYTPGVATAVALNLPLTVYLLRRAVKEGHLTRAQLLKAVALVTPAVLASLPLLFWLGRRLFA